MDDITEGTTNNSQEAGTAAMGEPTGTTAGSSSEKSTDAQAGTSTLSAMDTPSSAEANPSADHSTTGLPTSSSLPTSLSSVSDAGQSGAASASGEAGNGVATLLDGAATDVGVVNEDPNAGASPVDTSSASGTSSSAQAVLQGDGTAAAALTGGDTAGEQGNVPAAASDADTQSATQAESAQDAAAGRGFIQIETQRVMAEIAVARAHLAAFAGDAARNVHAALDGIERLIGMRD